MIEVMALHITYQVQICLDFRHIGDWRVKTLLQ